MRSGPTPGTTPRYEAHEIHINMTAAMLEGLFTLRVRQLADGGQPCALAAPHEAHVGAGDHA